MFVYLPTTAALWNPSTGALIKRLLGHSNVVTSIAFTPDMTTVISGSYDRVVKLWALSPGKPGRPQKLRIVDTGKYDMMLQWEAPVANGEDIFQYKVEGKSSRPGDTYKELTIVNLEPHEVCVCLNMCV
jgi:WD40 repeat protein